MARINFGLEELQAFVAIADKGSFKGAAETLFLSQPALSRRIEKLEQALGERLIERSTRRLAFTNVGREFLPEARATLYTLDQAVARLSGRKDLWRGQVTVAATPTVAHRRLPPVLRAFATQFPSVQIRMIDESANAVVEAVLSGEADFGLNFIGAQEPTLQFEPFADDRFVLVMPHDHRWARRRSVAWSELGGEKMVAVSRQSGNRLLIDHVLSALPIRPEAFYQSNHVEGALSLVEAGLGLAALPAMALPQRHPSVKAVALVEPVVHRMVGLISRKDRPLQPAAQALYRMLLQDTRRARPRPR